MCCEVLFSRVPYWLCVPSEPLRTLYGVPSAVLQWTAVEGPLQCRCGAVGEPPEPHRVTSAACRRPPMHLGAPCSPVPSCLCAT